MTNARPKRLNTTVHHYLAHATTNPLPFYESGTFWAGAGTVAVVIFGFLSFRTWQLGPRRPALAYRLASATPLIASTRLPQNTVGEIKLTYQGNPVTSPHVAELRVNCKGRGEIASDDFDRGKPLTFDLGAPIITILDTGPASTQIAEDNLAIDGSTLRVGPCVIRPGLALSIDLITDGAPSLSCTGNNNPMINNIKVREGATGDHRRISVPVLYLSALVAVTVAIQGLIYKPSGHDPLVLGVLLGVGVTMLAAALWLDTQGPSAPRSPSGRRD